MNKLFTLTGKILNGKHYIFYEVRNVLEIFLGNAFCYARSSPRRTFRIFEFIFVLYYIHSYLYYLSY